MAHEPTFDHACSLVEAVLKGTARREFVDEALAAKDFRRALQRVREAMRTNVWKAGGGKVHLDAIVKAFDARTREDGFHAIHDWDGKADRVNDNTIALDVLDYIVQERGVEQPDPLVLAVLIDYHFLYILALFSLRVWDEGSPDANLDRLDGLLGDLQGPGGSGQFFAANAETLMVVSTSHFEIRDQAYDDLLARVRTLGPAHRLSSALIHAATLGSHLRFGFEVTYVRDYALMRDDNGVDYRWQCFALATLFEEFDRRHPPGDAAGVSVPHDAIVEGLINGLTADATAFVGQHLPRCLAASEDEWKTCVRIFGRHRDELLREFDAHRPSESVYSPIALFFNFCQNVLKGNGGGRVAARHGVAADHE